MDRVLAAGAVVMDRGGRLLLVLRADEPQAGRWSLPGGKVEAGETPAQAAEREVREETGLIVRATHELGCIELPTADGRVFEIHDFRAELDAEAYAGGEDGPLLAGDDAADARWFTAQELPSQPLTDGLIGYLRQFGVYP